MKRTIQLAAAALFTAAAWSAQATTAVWTSPNSAYVSVTDAATWGGTVKTGDTEWAHDGATRYYNGARGRVWTHRQQGQTWTFTESTGTLTVNR